MPPPVSTASSATEQSILQSLQALLESAFIGRIKRGVDWHRVFQACWPYLVLGLGLLWFFSYNTWSYPLFDVDEPRYAETAREMLTAPGDWITPHFNYVKRFDKPVLFYWLIAASYTLLGVSEYAARLVSALAATLTALGLFYVTARETNRPTAWLVSLVFATMLEPFVMARWSVTDMTLSSFMALTWLGLYGTLRWSPRWAVVAGLTCGLGMLTKGPVALVLPGFTYLVSLALDFRSQWRQQLLSPWLWGSVILGFLIITPWYWAVAKANPGEFVDKFVFLHNVQRFASTVSGHQGPWYYYFPVLLIGTLPWTFLLPVVLFHTTAQFKALSPFMRYGVVWFGVVFLFFSVAQTKLLTYILPGFPALAILMGVSLGYWFNRNQASDGGALPTWIKGWIGVGLALVALISLGSVVYLVLNPVLMLPPALLRFYEPWLFQVVFGLSGIFFLVSAVSWFIQQPKLSIKTALAGSAVFLVLMSGLVLPRLSQLMQADLYKIAMMARRDHAVLATYETKKPSLVFYTQDKVYFVPERSNEVALTDGLLYHALHQPGRPLYLVVKNSALEAVLAQYHPVVRHYGVTYSLVQIQPNPDYKRTTPLDFSALPNQ